jgi:hypothetical protein
MSAGAVRSCIRAIVMSVSRKTAAWLGLVSYLFANTLAVSLHDHRQCCGHSAASQDRHGAHHHAGHRHSGHDHARCHSADQEGAGDELCAPHRCLVCEFFAQAPLTPPAAGLIPGGDLLLDEATVPALRFAHQATKTHLARGPPDQG